MPDETLPPANPPLCDGLDIDTFSKVFGKVNTSYKFFWLLALIQALEATGGDPRKISFARMAAGMLDAARRIVYVFRLRLVKDDKMAKWFRELERSDNWRQHNFYSLDTAIFKGREDKIPSATVNKMTKYTRHLFLSPFLNLTTGLSDEPRFREVREQAAERFNSESPPPYRFSDGGDEIVVHPKWVKYFSLHSAIIKSWVMWELAQYVQRVNPSVPGIVTKLDSNAKANPKEQRVFWQHAMNAQPDKFFCIYTGEKINAESFELDHYVPWSFIAHDNMWNLVPVSVAGNAEKSDNLPCNETYFDRFAEMQHRAINYLHGMPDSEDWEHIFEPYIADLNLDVIKQPVAADNLHSALKATIDPLLGIAKTRGFKSDWVFGGGED